jgi:hypothetical protein
MLVMHTQVKKEIEELKEKIKKQRDSLNDTTVRQKKRSCEKGADPSPVGKPGRTHSKSPTNLQKMVCLRIRCAAWSEGGLEGEEAEASLTVWLTRVCLCVCDP